MHVCEADSKRETVITWIDADVSPYLQYDIAKWLLNAIQADQILFLDSFLFPCFPVSYQIRIVSMFPLHSGLALSHLLQGIRRRVDDVRSSLFFL